MTAGLDDLGFARRTLNCLDNAGIRSLAQLRKMTDAELLLLPNFGQRSLREIRKVVSALDGGNGLSENPGLRDHIAVRVMELVVGADARTFVGHVSLGDEHATASFENVAAIAYGLADAMIARRKKP